MTSKEALEKIKNHAISDIDSIPLFAVDICKSINKELEEAYNIVLKDLERLERQDKILEILKTILSGDYLVRVYGYDMANILLTYLKSNDIVKEWLYGKD